MKELNEVSEIASIQNDNVSKLNLNKPLSFSESENDKRKSYSRWNTPMDFSEDKSTFNKSNQEVHPPFEWEKERPLPDLEENGPTVEGKLPTAPSFPPIDPIKYIAGKNVMNGDNPQEGLSPDKPKESSDADKNVDGENPSEIHTRNEQLEGKEHPVTGVPFERKTVKDADGNEVTGVFPVFDSMYDVQLPEDLYKASDKEQFAECNKQLKEAIEKDPELAKKFTPEQLEQIKNGDTPDGYVWHHNEETGKMQLVDLDVHKKTGHTGGKTIWGGGNENR